MSTLVKKVSHFFIFWSDGWPMLAVTWVGLCQTLAGARKGFSNSFRSVLFPSKLKEAWRYATRRMSSAV